MLNFTRKRNLKAIGWLSLLLLLATPMEIDAATKYKKQTTVDFDDALIEGKSRKPYATYLSQQKTSTFNNLNDWDLDLEKNIEQSVTRISELYDSE